MNRKLLESSFDFKKKMESEYPLIHNYVIFVKLILILNYRGVDRNITHLLLSDAVNNYLTKEGELFEKRKTIDDNTIELLWTSLYIC